jgi:hypothetical protein
VLLKGNSFNRTAQWAGRATSSIVNWVGSRRPRVWASTYILLIPLIGFIYWTLPMGSFFDSNLAREAGVKSDLAAAARLLTSALQRQESVDGESERTAELKWISGNAQYEASRKSIYVPVGSLHLNNSGDIAFDISGMGSGGVGTGSVTGYFLEHVILHAQTSDDLPTDLFSASSRNAYTISAATAPNIKMGDPPLGVLFPTKHSASAADPADSLLWLSNREVSAVDRLSDAGTGDPKDASGLYIRMTYFSAITITTLGYGDIAPITSVARILVAIEAISGVVLIGLFLNSVAQKWGKGGT